MKCQLKTASSDFIPLFIIKLNKGYIISNVETKQSHSDFDALHRELALLVTCFSLNMSILNSLS